MKAFCDYNEYDIVGEYEDAGKSGKSIEGRNAADVLAKLQVMPDFGVNLICVEDGDISDIVGDEIIIYQTEDGQTQIDVELEDDTVLKTTGEPKNQRKHERKKGRKTRCDIRG